MSKKENEQKLKAPFGFDGVVRGLHPTNVCFMPFFFNGALSQGIHFNKNSTLRRAKCY